MYTYDTIMLNRIQQWRPEYKDRILQLTPYKESINGLFGLPSIYRSHSAFRMIFTCRDFLLLFLFFGGGVDYSAFEISIICRDLLFWLSGSHQIANFYSIIIIIITISTILSLALFADISFWGRALWPSTLLLFFLSFEIGIICWDLSGRALWPSPDSKLLLPGESEFALNRMLFLI